MGGPKEDTSEKTKFDLVLIGYIISLIIILAAALEHIFGSVACSYYVSLLASYWSPIAGGIVILLYYGGSRELEYQYLAEVRLLIGITGFIPQTLATFCAGPFL